MKRGLLVTTLIAASSLVLASCEKTISYEDARKHVAENFTSTEQVMFDVELVTKVTEVDGFFKAFFETGDKTEKSSGLRGVLSAPALEMFGESATYKLDGKKLIAEKYLDVKTYLAQMNIDVTNLGDYSGSVFGKFSTDEQGYVVSEYSKVDNLTFKVSSSYGLEVKGKLSLERTITYTARPAN